MTVVKFWDFVSYFKYFSICIVLKNGPLTHIQAPLFIYQNLRQYLNMNISKTVKDKSLFSSTGLSCYQNESDSKIWDRYIKKCQIWLKYENSTSGNSRVLFCLD